MDFIERRQYFRIPMVSPIKISINEGDTAMVLMVDLSAGGLKILSQTPLNVADELMAVIPLLENEFVKIRGKIVWTREIELVKEFSFGVEYMAGVQFERPNEKVKNFIRMHFKI